MRLGIFLDTGPLSVITNPKKSHQTAEMLAWSVEHLRRGAHFIVPAIADYEVRRELIRLDRPASVAALDRWNEVVPERYIELTDATLKRAAHLWAQVRNCGVVTADPKEIDGDALISAQVLDYQQQQGLASGEIVVATTNVGHLSHFVPAKPWTEI